MSVSFSAWGDVFPPPWKHETLAAVSRERRSHRPGAASPLRRGASRAGLLALVALGAVAACKSESAGRGTRQWLRCACTYISDFDEPGAVSIDICSDGHGVEDVASACVRNDGVGVPTSCHCDAARRGPCERSERCRSVSSSP
jgi:hypothetical protein